jgi:hypothetical protein
MAEKRFLESRYKIMKMINEETIKPTLKDPVNQQSKNFEKNFKRTMTVNKVKLNEVDNLLTEKEFSLKKKIFTLPKMEALVFSDPRLLAKYNEMSEEGEEKFGYHYNETIMNMLFNDYVLNSPKYLQKYKMAIPKEKKRRDKSGINQAKKAGAEIIKKMDPQFKVKKPELKPEQQPMAQAAESVEAPIETTKVQFLVNEKDPENLDVFAYFPEENHDPQGKFKTSYSHVGQHSAIHPQYAAESRPATPEEYVDLKAELESIGYNLEVLNQTNETTGSGSSGAYAGPAAWKKGGDLMEDAEKVDETTSAGSAGGAAGYVGYAGPAAWGGGDLLNKGKTSPALRKPIWPGGTVIAESNYLTDPSGFEKYVKTLNEVHTPMDAPIIDKTSAFTSDTVKGWNVPDTKIEYNTLKTGKTDTPNLSSMEEQSGVNPDMYNTKEDLKQLVQSVKQRTGKGLTKDHIPMLANEALFTVAIQLADKYLSSKGIPIGWDELGDTNSMWDFIDKNGNMSYDRLFSAVKDATEDRLSGNDFGDFGLDEKAKSKEQQRLFGMAHAVQKGELPASKVGGAVEKIAKTVDPDDVEDFASTKHKGLPDTVSENPMLAAAATGFGAAMGNRVADKIGMEEGIFSKALGNLTPMGFILNYLRQKYPNTISAGEEADLRDNNIDFVDTQFNNASPDKLKAYAEDLYRSRLDKINKIKEDTQTMVQNNGTSMSNKATPTGDQPSNVDMGARSTGGMQESDLKLFEELDKELEAFSIHHNKLKVMAEERKPSALVLRDRVGSENEKNFKSDMKDSGTKEIIDIEKELQWKDQQTDVGDDPQKLGQDIEKKELKVTDGEALKNVGDSANDKGDEIPKRNFTDDEQHEVDMMRLGQHSLVYDNEPGKRFEDRMKADMGDKISKMRQDQLEVRSKLPTYNKDNQPTQDGEPEKYQFNKDKAGFNKQTGINEESMITGRYEDALNKRRLIDFTLNEVVINDKINENLFELDFTGLGNSYVSKTQNKKVIVNETVTNVLEEYKFLTDGKKVFAVKNPVQNLNENEQKDKKPVINEQVNKMKHLLGYKPNDFVNTKGTKENRGF